MYVYVDASTLIALGAVGELDTLHVLDGDLVVPEQVRAEVTTEPARTNLERFLETVAYSDHPEAIGGNVDEETGHRARTLLGDPEPSGDTALVVGVLACTGTDESVGVVSDDRRNRRSERRGQRTGRRRGEGPRPRTRQPGTSHDRRTPCDGVRPHRRRGLDSRLSRPPGTRAG